jgi:hypothetical protein
VAAESEAPPAAPDAAVFLFHKTRSRTQGRGEATDPVLEKAKMDGWKQMTTRSAYLSGNKIWPQPLIISPALVGLPLSCPDLWSAGLGDCAPASCGYFAACSGGCLSALCGWLLGWWWGGPCAVGWCAEDASWTTRQTETLSLSSDEILRQQDGTTRRQHELEATMDTKLEMTTG